MKEQNSEPVRLVHVNVDPRLWRRARRWLWAAAAIALTAYVAYLVRAIWIPLAIAFVIAMVLDPIVDRMERRGWSRTVATGLIYAAFVASVALALYFAVPPIVNQADEVSRQVSAYLPIPGNQARAERTLEAALERSHLPSYVRTAVQRGALELAQAVTRSAQWLTAHAMEVLSNLLWVIIIPIITFYALRDFHLIFAKALLIAPRERRELVQTLVAEVTGIFAKYLRGLALVSFMNGAATWLVLLLLGTPNALMLGVAAGLLYSIPYLGAILTILLIAAVAFIAPGGGLSYMLLVVGVNIVLHQILFDQIITPRVLGGHVGLHPILSIVALLIGNSALGILGMLLAVPVAACVQLVVVTLIPKLAEQIEIPAESRPASESVQELVESTKAEHVARDATTELHRSVTEAVEAIEAKTTRSPSDALEGEIEGEAGRPVQAAPG